MRRIDAIGLAVVTLHLAGCVSVTRIHGPDGTDNWLEIDCHGSQGGCYDAAAEQCPSGYVIADSASGTTTHVYSTGPGVVGASSMYHGTLLIQCQDRRPEHASHAVDKEEDEEAALAPVKDTSQCDAAYRQIDDLGPLWASWFQGEAADKVPKPSAFRRVCMELDEDVQTCLVTSYAQAHHDVCLGKLQGMPEERRDRIGKLLLRQ